MVTIGSILNQTVAPTLSKECQVLMDAAFAAQDYSLVKLVQDAHPKTFPSHEVAMAVCLTPEGKIRVSEPLLRCISHQSQDAVRLRVVEKLIESQDFSTSPDRIADYYREYINLGLTMSLQRCIHEPRKPTKNFIDWVHALAQERKPGANLSAEASLKTGSGATLSFRRWEEVRKALQKGVPLEKLGPLEVLGTDLVEGHCSSESFYPVLGVAKVKELFPSTDTLQAAYCSLTSSICFRAGGSSSNRHLLKELVHQSSIMPEFDTGTKYRAWMNYLSLAGALKMVERDTEIERIIEFPFSLENEIQALAQLASLWPLDRSGNKEHENALIKLKNRNPQIFSQRLADTAANILTYDSLGALYISPGNLELISKLTGFSPKLTNETVNHILEDCGKKDKVDTDRELVPRAVGALLYAHIHLGLELTETQVDEIFRLTQGLYGDEFAKNEYVFSPLLVKLDQNFQFSISKEKPPSIWKVLSRVGLRPSDTLIKELLADALELSPAKAVSAKKVSQILYQIDSIGIQLPQPAEIGDRGAISDRVLGPVSLSNLLNEARGILFIEYLEKWLGKLSIPQARAELLYSLILHSAATPYQVFDGINFVRSRSNVVPATAVLTNAAHYIVKERIYHRSFIKALQTLDPALPALDELRAAEERRWEEERKANLEEAEHNAPLCESMRDALREAQLIFCLNMNCDETDYLGMFGFEPGFIQIIEKIHTGEPRTFNEEWWEGLRVKLLVVNLGGFKLKMLQHENSFPRAQGGNAFLIRHSRGFHPDDMFKFKRFLDRSPEFYAILKELGVTLPRLEWMFADAHAEKGFIADDPKINPTRDFFYDLFNPR